MNIFIDEEFTGLHQNATLISIGCITEDNECFYGELTDFDMSQCNKWIKDEVLSNLILLNNLSIKDKSFDKVTNTHYIKGNKKQVSKELKTWLEFVSNETQIQFISDVCHYDFILLIDLLVGEALDLKKYNISPVCIDINRDIADYFHISEAKAFDIDREKIIEEQLKGIKIQKHNALFDAKVIKMIYDKIKRVDL